MAEHRAGANLNVGVGLTAAVKSRHTLVFHHLWNSRHAARLCRDREADLSSLKYRLPRGRTEWHRDGRGHVVGGFP